MRGKDLARLCDESGLKPQTIYTRAGLGRNEYYKILAKKNATVDDLCDIAKGLGAKPGDLIENSGGLPQDLRPVVSIFEGIHPRLRERALRAAEQFIDLEKDLGFKEPQREANVVPFHRAEEHVDMPDAAMRQLTEVMKEAGFPQRKAAIGHEYAVRFFGSVSAGEGVELFDDNDIPDEYRQIPSWAYKKGARGIFKVVGWSMLDMGIADGQILFVKPTPEPANGETVICRLNRKAFVKKLRRDSRGLPSKLVPKAPGYPEIDIGPNDEIEFYGVAIGNTGDL